MIAYPDSPCWPQACWADYAAAPPELWLATIAVAVLAALGACAPALLLWLATRRGRRAD